MQVCAVLNVPYDEFTKFIHKMIVQDIQASTQQEVAIDTITPGYQYRKSILNRMHKPEHVEVLIEQLEDGKYKAVFTSNQGTNSIQYTYVKKSEIETEVTYEEAYFGVTTSTEFSHKFFAFVSARGNKKRMKALLEKIETMILQERKEGA